MQITIELTEEQMDLLEKEVDIQLTDFSGEIDADMVSYAIGLLIEANGVY